MDGWVGELTELCLCTTSSPRCTVDSVSSDSSDESEAAGNNSLSENLFNLIGFLSLFDGLDSQVKFLWKMDSSSDLQHSRQF